MMNKQVIPVVHPTVKYVTKEGLVKFQLSYILEKFNVTATELEVLANVFLYGSKATGNIVKSGILTNEKTAENYVSKFRKMGIIQGLGSNTRLHPQINPHLSDIDFKIQFRLIDEQVKKTVSVDTEKLPEDNAPKD
jgi:hypothetical protein